MRQSKGFLALEDELDVIRDRLAAGGCPHQLGHGRRSSSVAPSGSSTTWQWLGSPGCCGGLIFSGASAVRNRYGEAWADQHLPPRAHERDSLLTAEHDGRCAARCRAA